MERKGKERDRQTDGKKTKRDVIKNHQEKEKA
jgi:hypothetical protein